MVDKWRDEYEERRSAEKAEAARALKVELGGHPNVKRIEVKYAGSGDEGNLEQIRGFDADDKEIELAKGLEEIVSEYAEEIIPDGYENNEGGQGTVEIDCVTGEVQINHSWNEITQIEEPFKAQL